MAVIVYLLCALTSAAISVLLWRGWRDSGAPLLKWSALCFAGLFLNNVLLVVDTRVVPGQDLSVWRTVPAVIGIAWLIYGLVTSDTA